MSGKADEWVSVLKLGSVSDAHFLKSILEAEGVSCVIQGAQSAGMFGNDQGFITMRLLVPAPDEERARQILEAVDEAEAHPEDVHFLCNVDQAGQELRDLDNLVLDLDALTLCSIGRDQLRTTIEAQLGEPELRETEAGLELRYPELGAIFVLRGDRLHTFRAIVATDHPAYPDLDEYPGFWDPGSTLRVPDGKALRKRFGKSPNQLPGPHGITLEWEREAESIYAEFDPRGNLMSLAVTFD